MKKISIHNFRGFSDFEMSFTPQVTLLVGDNASGKTSILKAVKYVLSSFFSGFSDENTVWQTPDENDFRQVVENDWTLPLQPIGIRFSLYDDLFPLQTLPKEDLNIRKVSPKSRTLIGGIAPLRNLGQEIQKNYYGLSEDKTAQRMLPLPLFDSISTVFTHTGKKIPKEKFLSVSPKATLGYLGCLTGGGFGAHWWQRIKVLAELRTRPWEIKGVKNAIEAALGKEGCQIIEGIKPIVSLNEIFIHCMDGSCITYDLLPDGYLRLLDIVVNLAFRCLLLNGELYGANSPLLTRGVVLIDELDLHLHPSLQAKVIKGLQNAFPKLQFIATTHAPRVMGGLENNSMGQVVQLVRDSQGNIEANKIPTFGRDVNSIFGLLGLSVRDVDIQVQLEKLFDLLEDGDNEEARKMLTEMKKRFGDNLPDLTEAETILTINSD